MDTARRSEPIANAYIERMFLPIGDTPNPKRFTPWVNWALIGVNVLVYAVVTLPMSGMAVDPRHPELPVYIDMLLRMLPPGVDARQVLASTSAWDLFVFSHGYKPGAAELSDLLSSMFMHAGLMHLAGNMLFLWIYGDNVEHRLGRMGYLVAYLISGVVATLGFAIFAGDSITPLVGASGAISGVLGLYFLLFPHNRVKVFVAFFPFLFRVFLVPARWVLGFYVVVDNLLPFLGDAQSSVAHGAHLGGFVAGLLLAWVGERMGWRAPWIDAGQLGTPRRPRVRRTEPKPSGALPVIRQAVARRQAEQALQALTQIDPAEITKLVTHEQLMLAGWLDESGHGVAALRLLRRALVGTRYPPDRASIHLAIALVQLRLDQPTAAYQQLLKAIELAPGSSTAIRAQQAMVAIDLYRREQR